MGRVRLHLQQIRSQCETNKSLGRRIATIVLTSLVVLSLVILSLSSSPLIQLSNASMAPSSWPMFHQNAQHTGLSPFPGPTLPFLKWTFHTGGAVDSPPAVGNGRIYVGSEDGNLYALNPQGVLLWKFQTSSPIRTSPAIGSDGTIYLAGYLGYENSQGILYAINPGGKLKWSVTISPLAGYSSYPTISSPTIGPDGTIYVSAMGVFVVAIRPDGTLKWELAAGALVLDSPAVAPDGTVYVGIDDPDPSGLCFQCLEALYPNGTVKWGALGYDPGYSSPTIGSDGTVYISGWAINPDGTVKWQTGTFLSPSIGPDGTIYGSVYGVLYANNPDGTLQWEFRVPGTSGGSCYVSVQQSSAAVGSNGLVYFGSGITHFCGGKDGNHLLTVEAFLYAVSPNGTMAWKFDTGSIVGVCGLLPCEQTFGVSDPAIGSDGTIYVGTSEGNLYAIG